MRAVCFRPCAILASRCTIATGSVSLVPAVRLGTLPCAAFYRSGERYQVLDIVSKNGGSFIARRDDPGECPGDGWTNLTLPGRRGAEGPVGPKADKGDQGAKGDAAPTILEWGIDSTFIAQFH